MVLEEMDAGMQNGLPFYIKASVLDRFNYWLDLLFIAWAVCGWGSYQQRVD